ncbi:MAG: hypothetical protein HC805_03835 [Alkalinema sp. RL_2_19]|nr:hypothetical protein [Alkalinema sp. RL_2_19]
MPLKIGDRVTTTEFSDDYPLMVLAIAGGRLAIGSPRWPWGANHAMEYHQITSVNGVPVAFPRHQTNKFRRRKAA